MVTYPRMAVTHHVTDNRFSLLPCIRPQSRQTERGEGEMGDKSGRQREAAK